MNVRRDIKHVINTSMNKTSCTSPDYGFMRLISREDNPNKETFICIPYTSSHHRLSLYSPTVLGNSMKTQNKASQVIQHSSIDVIYKRRVG